MHCTDTGLIELIQPNLYLLEKWKRKEERREERRKEGVKKGRKGGRKA